MGNSPRFMYLLTYQNHGGYEQNEKDLNLVHVENDFGELTDDVNEYLTSLSMSSKAFAELIEYYKLQERPVIITMVGDHAPSFIEDLPAKSFLNDFQRSIAMRSVPYVMWSNCEMKTPDNTEYLSMVDIVPMILKIAGLPESPFYQEIISLHDKLPIRTSEGMYMDLNECFGVYSADSAYYDIMSNYYYMEYNGLSVSDDYIKNLFLP